MFRINTNTTSIAAQRALAEVNKAQDSSLNKLSSGSRITQSADDAAGLAISEKLKGAIRSNVQANRNANDGISMVQVAEGGLTEISNMLVRLRELSIQAASDTVGEAERKFTDLEFQNLKMEIERISQVTEFNSTKLLNGEGEKLDLQIGINNDEFQDRISFNPGELNAGIESLQIESLQVGSKEGAQTGLTNIDNAIQAVSGQRASLGALQNRLISTSNNLQITNENLSAANSRIRDTDYAEETAKNVKMNILSAAGTSVLGQANAKGQNALKLIG